MNLTCRFIDGLETIMLVLPVARVPTAPRFAEESERTAAASDVANTPAVTKEWNAIDISGTKSVSAKELEARNQAAIQIGMHTDHFLNSFLKTKYCQENLACYQRFSKRKHFPFPNHKNLKSS